MSDQHTLDKTTLRQQLRHARHTLPPQQQAAIRQQLAKTLQALPEFQHSQHIAAYLANDGEPCCQTLINRLHLSGRHCYLPVLHRHRGALAMDFYAYRPGQSLRRNHYGILEPGSRRRAHIAPEALDMVLMPLVGFDRRGHRLGMGGGFYDRSFAFKNRSRKLGEKPLMVGIAHSVQEVAQLAAEPWDVPLDLIVTELEVIRVRRTA